MNIEELKTLLENKQSLPNVLILKCPNKDADFLFYQYIHKYGDNSNKVISFVEDINSLSSNAVSLFSNEDVSDHIYIYEVQKLEFVPITTQSLWIKCKTIDKKVKDAFKDNIVDMPKLESWHIKDYISTNLMWLKEHDQDELFDNYKSNLFRLNLEIEKLKLFDGDDLVYDDIKDQLYIDSTESTIFDLTNSIVKRDIVGIRCINVVDVDPFGLLQILIKNFRYVIDIQLARNPTPEYVGVSSKQFWAIKNYSCGKYTKEELVEIYKFLLSLDNRIKDGYISTSIVVDYIITKIMLIGG